MGGTSTITYKALDEAIAFAYAQIFLDNIRNWFVTRSAKVRSCETVRP